MAGPLDDNSQIDYAAIQRGETYKAPGEAPPPPGTWYARTNQFLSNLRDPVTAGISKVLTAPATKAGLPAPEMAAQAAANILNPIPGSVPEAATMALTAGLGALPAKGGTLLQRAGQAGLRAGAGALGGAGIGAAGAVMEDQPIGVSAGKGTLAGGLGGLMAGTGRAIGAPNAPTRMATAGIKKGAKEATVSPNLRAVLSKSAKDPKAFFSEATGKELDRLGSQNFEKMVAGLESSVGKETRFPFPSLAEPAAGIQPGGRGAAVPSMTIREARAKISELRAGGDRRGAWNIERDLLNGVEKAGGPTASYYPALQQFRADRDLAREHAAILERQALPGGSNPVDRPGLAGMQQAMGFGPKQPEIGRAIADLMMAAGHPTGPIGAGHGVRGGMRLLTPGGLTDPNLITRPGPLRRIGSPLAGTTAGMGAGRPIQATDVYADINQLAPPGVPPTPTNSDEEGTFTPPMRGAPEGRLGGGTR